jgi:hypothetical protein
VTSNDVVLMQATGQGERIFGFVGSYGDGFALIWIGFKELMHSLNLIQIV